MYAVIQLGSDQYKVAEGDTILADQISGKEGDKVAIEKVLLFAKGSDIRIGQPFLKDVKITAKIADQTKASKVTAFRYRRRKDSQKKIGHRQKYTSVHIAKIAA